MGGKGRHVVCDMTCADHAPNGKSPKAIVESVDEFYSEDLAQEVMRGMREAAARDAIHHPYQPILTIPKGTIPVR